MTPFLPTPSAVFRAAAVAVLLIGLLVAGGCSEPDALRDLEEAAKNVEILRDEVEDAKKAVEDRQQDLVDAQAKLDEAIESLRETEGRLNGAEAAIAEIATDDVLFRSVQASLLQELEDVAIAARVRDGVVTLTGSVDDPDYRDIAEEIASKTLGVLRVDNRIETVIAAGKAAPPAATEMAPESSEEEAAPTEAEF